mgnify:FL=1
MKKNIDVNKVPVAQFKKFDMNSLVFDDQGKFLNPRIAIIAKSGSGKSWLVKEIMHHIKDIPCGVVIAPTDKMNGFYNDFIPRAFTHHEYNETIIARVLKRQKDILGKNKDRAKAGKKPIDPRAYLIMDDCMSSKHLWLKDPNVLSIFNEGRHYQLTYILTMQYALGIQPELRANFDFIFLLGEDVVSNRVRLYQHYAGIFDSQQAFDKVFLQMTENYGCMVINNKIRSTDLSKKVFWYKAKQMKPFVVGIPKCIEWNKRHYDENYEKKEQIIDWSTFGPKKKIPNVKIRLI